MAYKFIQTRDPQNEFSKVDITFEIPSNDLNMTDMLELFSDFLKACGYSPNNIVNLPDENKND